MGKNTENTLPSNVEVLISYKDLYSRIHCSWTECRGATAREYYGCGLKVRMHSGITMIALF
jgi:hypothetical protein